jgi:triacylglycerol lipase
VAVNRTTWRDLLHPGDAPSFFDRVPLPPFDATAAGFSRVNAWWLAELSRLVYRHDAGEPDALLPSRRELLRWVGLEERNFWSDRRTGTQAMLVSASSPSAWAALVFRGTEQDVKDFRRDLLTYPSRVDDGDIRVHRGFLEGLEAVWGQIAAALAAVDGPVFHAGHSLGAALATLASWRRAPTSCYTFGSPRVGNAAFAAALAGVRVYRVVDGRDAIALVPPEGLGFRHVGELHELSAPDHRRGVLDQLRGWLDPPPFLADHAPINYVSRLLPG